MRQIVPSPAKLPQISRLVVVVLFHLPKPQHHLSNYSRSFSSLHFSLTIRVLRSASPNICSSSIPHHLHSRRAASALAYPYLTLLSAVTTILKSLTRAIPRAIEYWSSYSLLLTPISWILWFYSQEHKQHYTWTTPTQERWR